MKHGWLALFTLLIFTLPPSANAQSSKELWKKLDEAMQREIDAPKLEGDSSTDRGVRDSKRMMAGQVRAASDASAENIQFDSLLAQISSYFHSPEVSQIAGELRGALKKEREAKEAATVEKINAAIKHAVDAVHSARQPRDLDAILKELSELNSARERTSEETRAAMTELQAARQLVVHWQDYLAAVNAGDAKRATDTLHNLANSSEQNGNLIPRSEILALIEQSARGNHGPSQSLDEILAKAKSLADVAGVLKDLHALENHRQQMGGSGPVDEVRQAINALLPIEKIYREFLAGLPTNLEPALNQSDQGPAGVVPLRVELLLLMLPRYLSLPPDMKPQAGETVMAFVDRVMTSARDRGDMALFARVRDAKRVLSKGSQGGNNSGMSSFMAGQNQEAAGLYMLAVVSYNNALKSGTDDISPKLIGEKLEAIKAAHAEEYERGLAYFLNPPRTQEYPPLYMGGAPPHSVFPAPPPNPALAVPAATPAASRPATPHP